MSSSTTSLPTTGSSSTPSSTPTNSNNGAPSSSLYLFTFLATLFLLLFVSSAIIFRSFILRQRFRRRIEQAILDGVIIPNTPDAGRGTSRRRRAIGEKPKLWEAWVSPAHGDRWDTIVPVSAVPASWEFTKIEGGGMGMGTVIMSAPARPPVHRPTSPLSLSSPPPQPPPPPPLPPPPPVEDSQRPFYQRLLRNPFIRQADLLRSPDDGPPRPPIYEATPSSAVDDSLLRQQQQQQQQHSQNVQDRLQVTVLIAMPDVRRPHSEVQALSGHSKGKERGLDWDHDDDDLPEMALGMTELQFKDSGF